MQNKDKPPNSRQMVSCHTCEHAPVPEATDCVFCLFCLFVCACVLQCPWFTSHLLLSVGGPDGCQFISSSAPAGDSRLPIARSQSLTNPPSQPWRQSLQAHPSPIPTRPPPLEPVLESSPAPSPSVHPEQTPPTRHSDKGQSESHHCAVAPAASATVAPPLSV